MMGGVPTTVDGQALKLDADGNDVEVKGLFAVGEIACVSVHGANRLGGNSLLDLVVFGRAAGKHLGKVLSDANTSKEPTEANIEAALERYNRWEKGDGTECPNEIRKDLKECMQNNFGVFRDGPAMAEGLAELESIRKRLKMQN